MCYSVPRILVLGANDPDPGIETPVDKAGCLQCLSSPFSLLLNAQVMIPPGSYWFIDLASASIGWCCLYIIIQYGMSGRDWVMWSVPRGGRTDPEFFKAIDTYTYIKIIPMVLMCSICFMIVHMRDGALSWSFLWMRSWFTRLHVCMTGTSGTWADFCRWGEVQLLLKCYILNLGLRC